MFDTSRERVFQQRRVTVNPRWHYRPAQNRASGGTTFCSVSKCARLTRPNGLFFYSGCGESSRIVDFSWLYASTPGRDMSMPCSKLYFRVVILLPDPLHAQLHSPSLPVHAQHPHLHHLPHSNHAQGVLYIAIGHF